jgi:hypothetical protein
MFIAERKRTEREKEKQRNIKERNRKKIYREKVKQSTEDYLELEGLEFDTTKTSQNLNSWRFLIFGICGENDGALDGCFR